MNYYLLHYNKKVNGKIMIKQKKNLIDRATFGGNRKAVLLLLWIFPTSERELGLSVRVCVIKQAWSI